jgi:dienelactone hydrolase
MDTEDDMDAALAITERAVSIPSGATTLEGSLMIPAKAESLVIFVHGSGSSRFSPRNKYVADILNRAGTATLLFDLLTEEEDAIYETRFNIDLLTDRLIDATKWAQGDIETQDLRLGYFGASTGAAAALKAVPEFEETVGAVVSRGGRPDLAGQALAIVKAPTLLIVGGNDEPVITLNRRAYDQMERAKEKELAIIDFATHLFEEPGTLEEAARLAKEWFEKHLRFSSNI